MTDQLHGDRAGDAGPFQVPHRGAPEVMRDATGQAGRIGGSIPSAAEALDPLSVALGLARQFQDSPVLERGAVVRDPPGPCSKRLSPGSARGRSSSRRRSARSRAASATSPSSSRPGNACTRTCRRSWSGLPDSSAPANTSRRGAESVECAEPCSARAAVPLLA